MTNTTQANRPEYVKTIYIDESILAVIYAALNVAYTLSHVQSNDNGRPIHTLATRILKAIATGRGNGLLDLTAEEAEYITDALRKFRVFGHPQDDAKVAVISHRITLSLVDNAEDAP